MTINNQIKKVILSNIKETNDRKIGIEIENIIYNNKNERLPVNPGNYFSAHDLLQNLNDLIGENGQYSLEPGGQLEWASPPFKRLHDLQNSINEQKFLLNNILDQNNLKLVPFGVDPNFSPEDIELISKKRYQLMNLHMKKNGTMGRWMMRCTSSIQVNLDVSSENDMEEMTFIADCLHPITSYLFSNSPYKNNVAIKTNLRNNIWLNTDDKRCNNLFDHGIYRTNNLINNYINYFLSVPAIYSLDNDGKAIGAKNRFSELLIQLDTEGVLNENYILTFLRQIFTNVRLKNLVEIRGADRTPEGFEIAPAAFWVGILHDDFIRSKVLEEISSWNKQDRYLLNQSSLYLDKNQIGPKERIYGEWIKFFGELALEGLKIQSNKEHSLFEDFFNIIISEGPFSLQDKKNE